VVRVGRGHQASGNGTYRETRLLGKNMERKQLLFNLLVIVVAARGRTIYHAVTFDAADE